MGFEYRQATSYCWDSGVPTSAVLPLRAALTAGKAIVGGGRFDLRWLGAVYAVLFLAAFYGFQRLVRGLRVTARVLAPAAALLVFGGASYVPGFNSFYTDTASYVFLSLAAMAILRLVLNKDVKTWDYLAALACTLLLATSRSQHTPLALLLIPCFWLRFGRASFPSLPLQIAATAAILAAAWFMFAATPASYRTVESYNAFFYQALPHSRDPVADLSQLGLEPAMLRYSGKHAFLPDSPMQDAHQVEFFGRYLSVRSLTVYYLSHPRTAALVLRDALDEGSLQRVRMKIGKREYRLGNYQKGVGKPPEAQSHFMDVWSGLKSGVFGDRPVLYSGYAAGLLATLWILARRQPARLRARLTAVAAMWTAMVGAAAVLVIYDGVDTGRHLFLFNAMLDMTVCALICFA